MLIDHFKFQEPLYNIGEVLAPSRMRREATSMERHTPLLRSNDLSTTIKLISHESSGEHSVETGSFHDMKSYMSYIGANRLS